MYKVYHFQRPLNLFLPYGLYLLFTLPITGIGLISLRWNSLSAIDGGFLQILIQLRPSRLRFEIAAFKGYLGGYENTSDELSKLKVPSGELIATENTTVCEYVEVRVSGHKQE